MDLADRPAPDVTWITPNLAIGARILDDEWRRLAATGVGAVVDCRAEACDPVGLLESLGLAFLRVPTPDAGSFTPLQVADAVAWIEQQWAADRRVLVHCQAGKGRSVAIGGAALTRLGWSADDAVDLIRKYRPIITPTPGQLACLRSYAATQQIPLPNLAQLS